MSARSSCDGVNDKTDCASTSDRLYEAVAFPATFCVMSVETRGLDEDVGVACFIARARPLGCVGLWWADGASRFCALWAVSVSVLSIGAIDGDGT